MWRKRLRAAPQKALAMFHRPKNDTQQRSNRTITDTVETGTPQVIEELSIASVLVIQSSVKRSTNNSSSMVSTIVDPSNSSSTEPTTTNIDASITSCTMSDTSVDSTSNTISASTAQTRVNSTYSVDVASVNDFSLEKDSSYIDAASQCSISTSTAVKSHSLSSDVEEVPNPVPNTTSRGSSEDIVADNNWSGDDDKKSFLDSDIFNHQRSEMLPLIMSEIVSDSMAVHQQCASGNAASTSHQYIPPEEPRPVRSRSLCDAKAYSTLPSSNLTARQAAVVWSYTALSVKRTTDTQSCESDVEYELVKFGPNSPVQRRANRFFIAPLNMKLKLIPEPLYLEATQPAKVESVNE